MSKRLELRKGDRFRHLVVLGYLSAKKQETLWECECDCGKKCVVAGWKLTGGKRSSCGCRLQTKKHGATGTRLFSIWRQMKNRALQNTEKMKKKYKCYQGLGMADKWCNFSGFFEDMGKSYEEHVAKFGEKNTSIDRIDPTKGYFPPNCRWATVDQQSNNKINTKLYEYNGEKLSLPQWAKKVGFNKSTVQGRARKGWPIEKILTVKPVKTRVYPKKKKIAVELAEIKELL